MVASFRRLNRIPLCAFEKYRTVERFPFEDYGVRECGSNDSTIMPISTSAKARVKRLAVEAEVVVVVGVVGGSGSCSARGLGSGSCSSSRSSKRSRSSRTSRRSKHSRRGSGVNGTGSGSRTTEA